MSMVALLLALLGHDCLRVCRHENYNHSMTMLLISADGTGNSKTHRNNGYNGATRRLAAMHPATEQIATYLLCPLPCQPC